MKKVLVNMLFGMVLGSGSLSVWAQCAPGGQVTDGTSFGLPPFYCYYGDGSCMTHPAGQIPSSCQKSSNTPPKVLPDKWGAVAWNLDTGVFDTSFGEHSEAEAKKVALQKCGVGCKTFTTYKNQCIAAAEGDITRLTRSDPQRSQAEQKALSACSAKAKDCQLVFSECSLP